MLHHVNKKNIVLQIAQMSLDRTIILTLACLLMSIFSEVGGEEPRKSRSINDRAYQPRRNSIRFEDRDYNTGGYVIGPSYLDRSNVPIPNTVVFLSPPTIQDSREIQEEEDKLFQVIMSKDYHVSTPSELEKFDRIGERMIARANITEEAKRVVRQVKKQRPGFFWTLARVAFETVNETRSAVQQISTLVEANFIPDTTTARGGMNAALTTNGTTTARPTTSSGSNSTMTTTTTTEEPFKLTRSDLQGIIRRNFRGLVRLFNIEWQDALNQSQANVREFRQDLGNKISPYLQDNPDVV